MPVGGSDGVGPREGLAVANPADVPPPTTAGPIVRAPAESDIFVRLSRG